MPQVEDPGPLTPTQGSDAEPAGPIMHTISASSTTGSHEGNSNLPAEQRRAKAERLWALCKGFIHFFYPRCPVLHVSLTGTPVLIALRCRGEGFNFSVVERILDAMEIVYRHAIYLPSFQ